jgi:hypothetical protein
MNHPNEEPIQTSLEGIAEDLRPFAAKVLQAMTAAVDAVNKRLHGQLAKIFAAISPMDAVEVWPFWSPRAKTLAAEWNDLRTATMEAHEQQEVEESQTSSEPTPQDTPVVTPDVQLEDAQTNEKPARKYRKIEYVLGQNPFRAGSKNAKIFELLADGNGHTKEELAQLSSANEKSVGYLLWLLSRSNNIPVVKDRATKTYRLA